MGIMTNCHQSGNSKKCPLCRTWQADSDVGLFLFSLGYIRWRILVSFIEMLVVLLIISVLMLLFVPNLTKQKDAVSDTGNAAVVKVVESQAELYELKNVNEKATLGKLVADGRITDKQVASYKAYYGKNSSETRSVAD